MARLKNRAKEEGIAFQQLLNLFFQEEFIRRLAKSNHRDQLILKGGFLLYSISGFTTRPTVDADYLLKNHSNEMDSVEKLVRSIIEQKSTNDFMEIELRSIEPISEMKEYHGIRVNMIGYLGKTKTPFSIDFGVGDTIVPSALKRTLPVLLDGFEKPTILTYSLESTISEKLDAIIRFMEATGRMKDFYDIYYLATSFDFEGRKIQEAIYETFSKRATPFEKDSIQVIERLISNDDIITRWNVFCKKVLKYEMDLDEVVRLIISFLDPPFQAIIKENQFVKNWDSNKRHYE
ncbi:nucleotidyl transferase AbiEii/AbiGii toxin family protein [Trichococcus ilyis]|uniref:nucleotidyl transferase AbiEii/AbiGii toxin family protein n=1 Tax=Trichococcus ilyis TaxID=640938 RepID=UPI00194F7B43|nr:nucleotidyl transferase AbiEii/AbiGii toxin family protein [Trichococcus ilyis]